MSYTDDSASKKGPEKLNWNERMNVNMSLSLTPHMWLVTRLLLYYLNYFGPWLLWLL